MIINPEQMFHVEHLQKFHLFWFLSVGKRKIFRQDCFEAVPRGTKQSSVDNFVNNIMKKHVQVCMKC